MRDFAVIVCVVVAYHSVLSPQDLPGSLGTRRGSRRNMLVSSVNRHNIHRNHLHCVSFFDRAEARPAGQMMPRWLHGCKILSDPTIGSSLNIDLKILIFH
jgi:hypothetical protein